MYVKFFGRKEISIGLLLMVSSLMIADIWYEPISVMRILTIKSVSQSSGPSQQDLNLLFISCELLVTNYAQYPTLEPR